MYVEDLEKIRQGLRTLQARFRNSAMGYHLDTADSAAFSALEAEARLILEDALGPANNFTLGILSSIGGGYGGFMGGPSLACVQEVEQLIGAGVRTIERKERQAPVQAARQASKPAYVAAERLQQLQGIKSAAFDFSKLIQLCCELNIANEHDCHHAVAMLVRSVMDHVPPVFGFKSFAEVASNHGGGGTSFKKSMDHLQKSLRNIADGHLHSHIRSRETLPTAAQVDFRGALDLLLGEVVRIA